jgi:uncharacterized repeat protein (TIGR02543 family)
VYGVTNVGGLVGSQATSATIQNSVALNLVVNGTSSVGRVVGASTDILTNNYAIQTMLVNGQVSQSGAADNYDGANLTVSNVFRSNWWTPSGPAFDTNSWDFSQLSSTTSRLPFLKDVGGNQAPALSTLVNFVDSAFHECVNQELGLASDIDLTAATAQTVTNLDCAEFEIASLADLKSFPNVTVADFSLNNVSSLPAGTFAGMSKLQSLNLAGNKIASLNSTTFADLTGLKTLNLNQNQLYIMDASYFSGLTNLASLSLRSQAAKLTGVTKSFANPISVAGITPELGSLNNLRDLGGEEYGLLAANGSGAWSAIFAVGGNNYTFDGTLQVSGSPFLPYTVRYDSHTGLGGRSETQVFPWEEFIVANADGFNKTGYTMTDWNRNPNGTGDRFGFGDVVSNLSLVEGAVVTLYAQWLANNYTIAYNINGADSGSTPASTPAVYDQSALLSDGAGLTKTGHTLDGWALSENGPVSYGLGKEAINLTDVNNDVKILYAHWEKQVIPVTFELQNGNPVVIRDVDYGDFVVPPSDPVRAGYRFTGWFDAAETGAPFDFERVITSATTVYAHWIQLFTVTFMSQGGSPASFSQTVEFQSSATLPSNPTRNGYKFIGWFTEQEVGSPFDFSQPIVSNVTVYAHWLRQWTVTFNYQNGTSNLILTVDSGSQVSPPADPTRANYIFQGWFNQAYGGEHFDFGIAIEANTQIYAQWEIVKYLITFNSQGGDAVANQNVAFGEMVIKPTDPKRAGYTFLGWFTASDCQIKYNFAASVNVGFSIYACWNAVESPTTSTTPSPDNPTPTTSPSPIPEGTPTNSQVSESDSNKSDEIIVQLPNADGPNYAFTDTKSLPADRQADIGWLARVRVTVGTGCVQVGTGFGGKNCKYLPAQAVNRGAMAQFLQKMAGVSDDKLASVFQNTVSKFKDISSLKTTNSSRYYAILWLADLGITSGCVADSSKFCPQNSVTRGAMGEFMQKFAGVENEPDSNSNFADVSTKAVTVKYDGSPKSVKVNACSTARIGAINWLAEAGITKGSGKYKGATTFRPQDSVNRGSMAQFLHRLYDWVKASGVV